MHPPDRHPFCCLLWGQQQPGEVLDLSLPAHVYIGSGHYPPDEEGDLVTLSYEIRLVGTRLGDSGPELVDSTVSSLCRCLPKCPALMEPRDDSSCSHALQAVSPEITTGGNTGSVSSVRRRPVSSRPSFRSNGGPFEILRASYSLWRPPEHMVSI